MKRWTLFILLLAGNLSGNLFACGPYYPMGDDIRFVLWKPEVFNYPGFIQFGYTANLSYESPVNQIDLLKPNIELWRKRCNNMPTVLDTYRAIYLLGDEINNPESRNSFIGCLHQKKETEAIAYLNFAKKCNTCNSVADDPWERNDAVYVPKRRGLIREAIRRAHGCIDQDIQLRYAFLAIRLAFYNNDNHQINEIYDHFFKERKVRNLVDYWGLYFKITTVKNPVERNFLAAQVFANAPDKRSASFLQFDASIPIENTLTLATNQQEKAAVWQLSGFKNSGKTLEILKKLYLLDPGSPGLAFLLQREVNKLEDWIFTPYYTCFNPSLNFNADFGQIYPAARIKEDRDYARQVVDFISKANLSKVENPLLWRMAKAWLQYMSEDYTGALKEIAAMELAFQSKKHIIRQLAILKSLCLNAARNGNAIPDVIKPILQSELAAGNYKFVFAIARELEYKGNTTDAAALLSRLKQRNGHPEQEGFWRNGIYWRSKRAYATLYVNYYDDYFFYLDAEYTSEQLKSLLESVNQTSRDDAFTKWKFEVLKKELPRLYDLAGTKAIRSNHLDDALTYFRQVNDTLWHSNYFPYKKYLNANPFYTNFFNEHRPTRADTIHYNKAELINALLKKIRTAENPASINRDLDYFLIANCYFNMTQYGNSWMMRRYYWTTNAHPTKLEDDDEYFNCQWAKKYYLKAMENSKSEKFKALCLRMAGRCENFRLKRQIPDSDRIQNPLQNSYYQDLRRDYGKYYHDLMSNCESIELFFRSAS